MTGTGEREEEGADIYTVWLLTSVKCRNAAPYIGSGDDIVALGCLLSDVRQDTFCRQVERKGAVTFQKL